MKAARATNRRFRKARAALAVPLPKVAVFRRLPATALHG